MGFECLLVLTRLLVVVILNDNRTAHSQLWLPTAGCIPTGVSILQELRAQVIVSERYLLWVTPDHHHG